MADKVVGLQLQVEAAGAVKSVGEVKDLLNNAREQARMIGQAFGESSTEFQQAQKDVEKIVQTFSKFGDTRKELKEAEKIARAMAAAYGATSKEALAAAAAVAEIRDSIKDAKEVSDLFDPGAKFAAIGNVVKTSAAGFAGLQGAMGLFGAESEKVQQTLLKVQSAMALSEGLSAVVDARKDFTRLGDIIKTKVVTAFSTLKGAIIATGIGALVVALGLIIANFEAVKKAVMNMFPGLGKLAGMIGGLIDKFTDFIGITTETERKLNALSKATENTIKAQEQFLEMNADKYDEFTQRKMKSAIDFNKTKQKLLDQESAGEISAGQSAALLAMAVDKRNREISKSDGDRVKGSEEAEKKIVDAQKAGMDKAAGLRKAAQDKINEEKKAAAERDKSAIEELYKLRNENFIASIKDEIEQQKARIRIQNEGEIQRIESLKISAEIRKALIAEIRIKEAAALQEIEDKLNAEKQAKETEAWEAKQVLLDEQMLKDVEATAARMKAKAEVMASINEGGMSPEELELFKLDETYKKKFAIIQGNELAELALKEQFEEAKSKLKQKFADQELQIVANGLSAVSELIGAQTAAGKALAIAAAVINTYKAASNALANTPGPPPFPQIAAIGAIAMGLKNVKEILKVQVPGASGGGGGSAPNIQAPILPQQQSTNINQAQINQLSNATSRAFVIESDMTSNQEKIRRLNRAARIG